VNKEMNDCPLPWVKDPAEFERFKRTVNQKLNEIEDDEAMNEQLEALTKRVDEMEAKVKVLEKVPAPEWFIDEFGKHALDGIVSDMSGDIGFWRNTAVTLRIMLKKL
jgi:hypothetical protein